MLLGDWASNQNNKAPRFQAGHIRTSRAGKQRAELRPDEALGLAMVPGAWQGGQTQSGVIISQEVLVHEVKAKWSRERGSVPK